MHEHEESSWLRSDAHQLYYEKIIADGAVRVGKRGAMLRFSINQAWAVLGKYQNAQVLEFGVHTGRDLCLIDRMVRQKESEQRSIPTAKDSTSSIDESKDYNHHRQKVIIHGFDSFQGLPESWDNGQEGFEKGKFDLGGCPPDLKEVCQHLGFPDEDIEQNVMLCSGWFDDTLPSFFDQHPYPIAYCHADADLYGSTMTFLGEMCRRKLLVKGSVITFDEYANYDGWKEGEYKAWQEIVKKYQIHFRYICYHAPTSVAKMTRQGQVVFNPHGYQSVSVIVTKVPW